MEVFWEFIIGPILMLRRPTNIVEIGSEEGRTTQLLLGFCRCYGATLHAIEPLPRFDVAAWRAEYGEQFVLHQHLSLEAVPILGPFDLILLDGDHNWYTVFHELKALEQRSAELGQPFPMVILHDIGWPYGRRDLYYSPESIPAEYCHPYEQKGMRPGSSALGNAAFNANLWNASHEGGPRNGVLTAVEDFLKESKQPLHLIQVPGFHGLGILYPPAIAEQNAELANFLRGLELSPFLRRYVDLLELSRLNSVVSTQEYERALGQRDAAHKEFLDFLQGKLRLAVRVIEARDDEIAQLRQQLTDIANVPSSERTTNPGPSGDLGV